MSLDFGPALREWRQQRRMSQLDLGLSANVSARHISFLETGRARPSRSMVLQLCEELEVPRAARNRLLTAAGLAPAYGARGLSEDEMAPVRDAVDWMLQRHVPYPGMALDRHWHLVSLNTPAARLLGPLGLGAGASLLEALAGHDGLRAAIANLDEVIRHTITRLRTESAHLGGDPVLDAAVARFAAEVGPEGRGEMGVMPPVIPTRYRMGEVELALFSTLAQFGTAEDVALAELKIELMFPADETTRRLLEAAAG